MPMAKTSVQLQAASRRLMDEVSLLDDLARRLVGVLSEVKDPGDLSKERAREISELCTEIDMNNLDELIDKYDESYGTAQTLGRLREFIPGGEPVKRGGAA